ncbi:LOW QUALITY PROTEIN: non-ribosomal peptide synthetase, partial [Micromonospora sp. M42]
MGEIEAVLAACPGVERVAVEAVPGPAGAELVAFLTPAGAPGDDELRAYAATRLTTAMLPARTVRLDALPVSPVTGKLDRPALRELAAATPAAVADASADDDPVTAAVRRVWTRLLGAAPAPDSDFLAAGGNSIAAMRLVAALRAELGRQVDTRVLFADRTFAALVDRVRAADPADADGLTTGNPPTLSPPQRRLWFMDQLAPSSAPYNIAVAHRLRGPLDVAALGAALRAVAERHDVLRWRIPQNGGVPYAVREEPTDVAVPVVDLTAAADPDTELAGMLAAGAGHAFDLATGPPWQVTVYRLAAQEHVLAVTVHHAVFDGWSEALLYDELALAYARALGRSVPGRPPLPATYADYAVWRPTGTGAAERPTWPGGPRTWPARRRCWTCPATGPARPCRRTPARRPRYGWTRPPTGTCATCRAARHHSRRGAAGRVRRAAAPGHRRRRARARRDRRRPAAGRVRRGDRVLHRHRAGAGPLRRRELRRASRPGRRRAARGHRPPGRAAGTHRGGARRGPGHLPRPAGAGAVQRAQLRPAPAGADRPGGRAGVGAQARLAVRPDRLRGGARRAGRRRGGAQPGPVHRRADQ